MKPQPAQSNGQGDPNTSPGAQSPEAEVRRLLSLGKAKQAVELAKEHHKKSPSADSQRLLVEAYVARIEQFFNKGMVQEAQTLVTLVQQRFPAERHQLQQTEVLAAAASGRVDDLLRPLASDQTPPRTRALILETLARKFTDLPAVAACGALGADHPVRLGAAAIGRAFAAVTRGPVSDADIALPEISHRSPFAAWKMAIRAIAAFYRQDDAGCLRALDAIPVDSAVAPIAAAMRGLLDRSKPLTGMAGVLRQRVLADDRPLRSALQKIETSLQIRDSGALRAGIREALRACAAAHPRLLEKLRQQISIVCFVQAVPAKSITSALGSTVKDATFWRLLARASESDAPSVISALYWRQFLCHAQAEGIVSPKGPEAAVVWLHIANLLSELSLAELAVDRDRAGRFAIISSLYVDQPPEISRLRPSSDKALAEIVLQPGEGYRQAALIRPQSQTFAMWWQWAQRAGLPDKSREDIALQWHHGCPRDAQPLAYLSSLAESRSAFSRAIKWLTAAEAIDPMNHDVRQARVRLTLSIAWRHFAEGKAHLVEKDLAELETLPSMREGDRGAVLESMRGAWHALRGDADAEKASYEAVLKRMGPLAGSAVYNSIAHLATQADIHSAVTTERSVFNGEPLEVALATARVIHLASDLMLKLWRPEAWVSPVMQVLRQIPCPLSTGDLLVLGTGAISFSDGEMAYQASVAGLERTNPPAVTARFLLRRAQSLDKIWQQPRATQCLRAALELAKQAHEQDLIQEIFAAVDRDPVTRRIIANAQSHKAMTEKVLQAVVDNEKKAREFPRSHAQARDYVVAEAVEDQAPAGGFGGFSPNDNLFDDDEDSQEDDKFGEELPWDSGDDFGRGHKSPDPRILDRLLDETGFESPEQFMQNPEILIDAMAKSLGRKLSQMERDIFVEQLHAMIGAAGDSSGHRKKHRKRRR